MQSRDGYRVSLYSDIRPKSTIHLTCAMTPMTCSMISDILTTVQAKAIFYHFKQIVPMILPCPLQEPDVWREYDVDGFIIVFSITDRRSYQKASDAVNNIREKDTESMKPVILVANKSDLERSRMIGKEGTENKDVGRIKTRTTRRRVPYKWRQICTKTSVFICTLDN